MERVSSDGAVVAAIAILAGCAFLGAGPGLCGEGPLSIPDEVPYRELKFEEHGPSGFRIDPVPSDWRAVSLDGTWKFKELPAGTTGTSSDVTNPLNDEGMRKGFFKAGFDDSGWVDLPVPSSWYQTPTRKHIKGMLAWYRRRFEVKPEYLAGGRRVVLDFRRVAWQADVWVNGKRAGERHSARWDSFEYDVTSLVSPGENVLTVRVYDYVGHESYQRRNIGGIYHPVRLLSIPSEVFTNRIMVTTLREEKAVALKAEFTNATGRPLRCRLKAEVADWKSGRATDRARLGSFTVPPGKNWIDLGKMRLAAPVPWSVENPHLYTLRLVDERGRCVGFERFGFRDFRARGEWLYLNGEKFKPRGFTFDAWRGPFWNKDGDMERILRHMKSIGINMIRPHCNQGILPETFYNLCDELGFVVYEDWPGTRYAGTYGVTRAADMPELKAWASYRQHILDYYSHPSLCMWSFGNELYEGHHGYYHSEWLDVLYGKVKKLDEQGRPICTSTGRHTINAISAELLKERTDVLDDHQYRGSYCGSWQENIAHIDRYAEAALEYYKEPKPKIDCEYAVPGDNLRYRTLTFNKLYPAFQLDPATAEFKRQYIEFLKSKMPEIGSYIRVKLNYCSPRVYVTREAECRRLYTENLFKRIVEIYRRAGTKCLGGHTNAQWYDLLLRTLGHGNTSTRYGKPGPIDVTKDAWIEMPLSPTVRRVYNPTLVSAGPFNQHPMASSRQEVEVFVTNDLNEAGSFGVVAQLRFRRGRPVTLPSLWFGRIGGMEQKSRKLFFTAPSRRETARGRLELYLFKNGKRAGDNYYPLTVAVADPRPITWIAEVALYDAGERLFGPLMEGTTTRALKSLGVRARSVEDFEALGAYRFLIVGANSFDKKLIEAGENIYDWVKNGGKLLCFEQNLCGKVPFYPNYSVVAGRPSNHVSLSVPAHPVFKGLTEQDFDSWAGYGGTMFDFILSPLNEGLIAIAPSGSHNDVEDARPVLADVKLGDGEIVFSQLSATKRCDTDSVARRYLQNLLNYFLRRGVQRFALKLPEEAFAKMAFVEDKDALHIDLRRFVNRGFEDKVSGDRRGGWTDFGASFNEIPPGRSRLQGPVPFEVIEPAKNDGKSCIVLKGEKRQYFPEKVTGIPVNAKLNSVFILHTAMYARPGPSVKYVFHYENGETRRFIATTERDIPDWWQAKDRLNAIVVFRAGNKGLYLSEFVNPLPKVTIKTMDIVSCGKSIPIVVAVTGRKRFTSVIAGQGEE